MTRVKVVRCIARMNVGGPAVQITGLMQGLLPEFDQTLVHGLCAPDEEDYLVSNSLELHSLLIPELGQRVRPVDDAKAFLKIRKYLRSERPDILHTHTFKAGFVGRLAALTLTRRPKLVHTFHGHLLTGYYGFTVRRIIVFVEAFLARFTDLLIAVGEQVRTDLLRAGIGSIDRFRIVNPGIAPAQRLDQDQSRDALNIERDLFTVGFVGRIAPIKRIDRFLAAIQLINHPIQVIIAGDGQNRESAEKLCIEKSLPVTFLGWYKDLDTLYSACDLVVLTSDNEGAPLSLIEAQMRGVPVVSTKVGSVADTVIIPNVTGITTALDPQCIAEAIEVFIKMPVTDRARWSDASLAHANQKFSYERLCREHEKLYLNLMNGG